MDLHTMIVEAVAREHVRRGRGENMGTVERLRAILALTLGEDFIAAAGGGWVEAQPSTYEFSHNGIPFYIYETRERGLMIGSVGESKPIRSLDEALMFIDQMNDPVRQTWTWTW